MRSTTLMMMCLLELPRAVGRQSVPSLPSSECSLPLPVHDASSSLPNRPSLIRYVVPSPQCAGERGTQFHSSQQCAGESGTQFHSSQQCAGESGTQFHSSQQCAGESGTQFHSSQQCTGEVEPSSIPPSNVLEKVEPSSIPPSWVLMAFFPPALHRVAAEVWSPHE